MTSRLAITMGDAAGIGPEIVVRLYAEGRVPAGTFVVGDAGSLRRAAALTGVEIPVHEIAAPEEAEAAPSRLEVLPAGTALPADLPYGAVDARAGRAAYDAVCLAIDLALEGRIAGIVTAPLNKKSLDLAGAPHPDHTSLLAHRASAATHAMMLVGGGLRAALVTTHLSLREALAQLTVDRELEVIRLVDAELRRLGIDAPRIAVAGVNPHAGEDGLFGDEEQRIVAPAVAAARAEGIDCSGPHPGDTVFLRALRGGFDAVVAQYHDQGLIPVKLLGFDEGVNVTLGLGFVRTSVDHGTAFDIAGTGVASAESLDAAFRLAQELVAVRTVTAERTDG